MIGMRIKRFVSRHSFRPAMPGGAALCCDIASDTAAAPLGQLFGHCWANVFVSAQR